MSKVKQTINHNIITRHCSYKKRKKVEKISRGNRSQYHILQGFCDPGKMKIKYFHGGFLRKSYF